jgi:hypothetical protein
MVRVHAPEPILSMTYNRLRIWKFKTIPYKLNHPVSNILKQLAVVVCQGGSDVTKPAPKQILGNAAPSTAW